MKNSDNYKKPNPIIYDVVRLYYHLYMKLHLHHHFVRNEARNIKGPAIYLSTHVSFFEHGVDANAVKKRMNYVAADTVYYTIAYKLLKLIGVIHKQQFFSKLQEFKTMKDVIKHNGIICIYPAGLCTADGRNTPLPVATAKWLKMMGVDVYIAKHNGFYMFHPKWSKKEFPGPTETEIYKLFSKDELKNAPLEELKNKLENAMAYDDYLWQEQHHYKYKNIVPDGLENVLYSCPRCHKHFSIELKNHKLACTSCGFTKEMDEYGFFKVSKEDALKYPPEWHRILIENLKAEIKNNPEFEYISEVKIKRQNKVKKRFERIGKGTVKINRENIIITLENKEQIYNEKTLNFSILPMIPGDYFDLQNGKTIFKCIPVEPKDVSYITDIVIALYKLRENVK